MIEMSTGDDDPYCRLLQRNPSLNTCSVTPEKQSIAFAAKERDIIGRSVGKGWESKKRNLPAPPSGISIFSTRSWSVLCFNFSCKFDKYSSQFELSSFSKNVKQNIY